MKRPKPLVDLAEYWRQCAGLAPDVHGPAMPPMIAWQRRGEPGWPYHEPEWLSGEKLAAHRAKEKT
jgi:hypothetical protein